MFVVRDIKTWEIVGEFDTHQEAERFIDDDRNDRNLTIEDSDEELDWVVKKALAQDTTVTDCVSAYLEAYEDTDVMTQADLEETIRDLEKGNEEEREQATRLNDLLNSYPTCTYFDYYNEQPILSKEWVLNKLGY